MVNQKNRLFQKKKPIKKFKNIVLKWLKYLVLFLFLLIILLSTPFVQSKLATLATDSLNKKFDTDVLIKKVDLSLLGSVVLKDVEIRDHHKDTLIFVKNLIYDIYIPI